MILTYNEDIPGHKEIVEEIYSSYIRDKFNLKSIKKLDKKQVADFLKILIYKMGHFQVVGKVDKKNIGPYFEYLKKLKADYFVDENQKILVIKNISVVKKEGG